MARNIEHQLQCACVKWFRYEYPEHHLRFFAVPNGGRRDAVTGSVMKAEGVVAGVADALLLVPNDTHHGLCIEFKTKQGRQSPSQKEWQAAVAKSGYRYEVVRSFDEFRRVVTDYLRKKFD